MDRRGGQVWSIDLIIAVVIFLLAISIFYFFTNSRISNNQSKLEIESRIVADKLTGDENVSVMNGTVIDEERLTQLAQLSYDDLKQKLGIRGDFCILLYDQDKHVILINNGTDNLVGIGNPELNITLPEYNRNGVWCHCGDAIDDCTSIS